MRQDAFSLDLPAEPINLGTARTFASQVARHFGCEDDELMDLKLAVSEACTESMGEGAEGGIRLLATRQGDRLRFEITGGGSYADIPAIEFLGSGPARLELIRSLFPDAAVAPKDGGVYALRFSLPVRG